jgi:hypothetical protein
MNIFTIELQRIITARTGCTSFSSAKLVTYLDSHIDTVNLYDTVVILEHLIISDIAPEQCIISIVWLKLCKLYPKQSILFSWDYVTALYHFCIDECCCNNNNIDDVLYSILSMYYIDDDNVFCVANTLNMLQCQFVTYWIDIPTR